MNSGLPVDIDSEKCVLGSVLLDEAFLDDVTGVLGIEDFSLDKHQTIYRRMRDLREAGEVVDRVTLASALERHGELVPAGGLGYLLDLDEGLPRLPSIDAYVRIVQEKAVLRRAIYIAQGLIDRCMSSDASVDVRADAERAISEIGAKQVKHGAWQSPGEVIAAYPGGLNAFLCPKHGGNGLETPWPGLTDSLAGLHRGDLFVLAGRPGMGKTIAACQFALHAALKGELSAVISLEMSNAALIHRMICGLARVEHQKSRTGWLNRDERQRAGEAVERIANIPLRLDQTRAKTMPAVTAAVRKLTAKSGKPRVLVIDHLQLMVGGRGGRENRNTELGAICHAMKHLAGDLECTLILLSQLNRQCEIENRRPQLSDLRETGDLEQDADVVMFVHRPEAYAKNHEREDLRGHAEFIIAKQREGPTGKRAMVFLGGIQRFESAAEDAGLESIE